MEQDLASCTYFLSAKVRSYREKVTDSGAHFQAGCCSVGSPPAPPVLLVISDGLSEPVQGHAD